MSVAISAVPREVLVAALEAKQKKVAEESFRAFVEQAWHVLEPSTPFVPAMHFDAICLHLQAVVENRIGNLSINCPPGSAKSLLTSVFWPAWVWGPKNMASMRWVFASYREDLALRDAVKCRTLIDSKWYRDRWGERVIFREDQNKTKRYENLATGYREVTSVGTGTGSRGTIVTVDDCQSVNQAMSDAERNHANTWWCSTMSSRLNDEGTGHFVQIQQRLHEDDLTGRLKSMGAPYEFLVLPEEFDPSERCATSIWEDPRTEFHELLWPSKRNREAVENLKKMLGTYHFESQYNQRPAPAGGGTFKDWWWRYWKPKYMRLPPVRVRLADGTTAEIEAIDVPETFDEVIQSWDLAFKGDPKSDFVVGGLIGAKGADRFVLDLDRDRRDFPATVACIEIHSKKIPGKPGSGDWSHAVAKIVEDKANGPAVIASLKKSIPGLIAVNPEGGKDSRANACAPLVEAGNVYLPHPQIASWVEAWRHEFGMFPAGTNDDQVDMLSQALHRLRNVRPRSVKQPEKAQVYQMDRGGRLDSGTRWMQ